MLFSCSVSWQRNVRINFTLHSEFVSSKINWPYYSPSTNCTSHVDFKIVYRHCLKNEWAMVWANERNTVSFTGRSRQPADLRFQGCESHDKLQSLYWNIPLYRVKNNESSVTITTHKHSMLLSCCYFLFSHLNTLKRVLDFWKIYLDHHSGITDNEVKKCQNVA